MVAIALLAFAINVAAVGWALVMVAETIKSGTNPMIWLILSVVLVVTVAWLGQFIARRAGNGLAHSHET